VGAQLVAALAIELVALATCRGIVHTHDLGEPLEPAEEGTDRWAVENGYVSVTPLRLDLTDEKELSEKLTRQKL